MSNQLQERKAYRCENPACSLGAVGHPGHFTGGITADGVNVLTGRPVESLKEGTDYGDGFCPNCGVKGVPDAEHTQALPPGKHTTTHASAKGGESDA